MSSFLFHKVFMDIKRKTKQTPKITFEAIKWFFNVWIWSLVLCFSQTTLATLYKLCQCDIWNVLLKVKPSKKRISKKMKWRVADGGWWWKKNLLHSPTSVTVWTKCDTAHTHTHTQDAPASQAINLPLWQQARTQCIIMHIEATHLNATFGIPLPFPHFDI